MTLVRKGKMVGKDSSVTPFSSQYTLVCCCRLSLVVPRPIPRPYMYTGIQHISVAHPYRWFVPQIYCTTNPNTSHQFSPKANAKATLRIKTLYNPIYGPIICCTYCMQLSTIVRNVVAPYGAWRAARTPPAMHARAPISGDRPHPATPRTAPHPRL